MRLDLPQCNFKNCKYSLDGNCIKPDEFPKCEYIVLKQNEMYQNLNNFGFQQDIVVCPCCGASFRRQ